MRQIKFWITLVCVFGLGSNLFAQDTTDEVAIKALIEKVTTAWNNRDAASLGSLVDEAVIYVDSDGKQLHGKQAYLKRHEEVLQIPALKESRSYSTVRNLHLFPSAKNGSSLAVLDVQWRLTKILSNDNQKAPDRQGHSDLLLKKSAGGAWEIMAHRTFRFESLDATASIKKAFTQREQAWNTQDLDGLLSDMADDVQYESSDGEKISGKEKLEAKYRSLFAGPLKNSKTKYEIEQVQFVQDDIALVDANWTIKTNDGNSKTGSSVILMRKFLEKDWKVVSLRPRENGHDESKR